MHYLAGVESPGGGERSRWRLVIAFTGKPSAGWRGCYSPTWTNRGHVQPKLAGLLHFYTASLISKVFWLDSPQQKDPEMRMHVQVCLPGKCKDHQQKTGKVTWGGSGVQKSCAVKLATTGVMRLAGEFPQS
jgi:hypothetical protein